MPSLRSTHFGVDASKRQVPTAAPTPKYVQCASVDIEAFKFYAFPLLICRLQQTPTATRWIYHRMNALQLCTHGD
jgi:hypothetical protein